MNRDKQVDNLIENPIFQQWVREPNAQLDEYWEEWINGNLEKAQQVEQAKKLLLSISFKKDAMEEEEMDVLWDKIKSGVENNYPIHVRETTNNNWWMYAASISLLLFAIGYYLIPKEQEVKVEPKITYVEKTNQLGQKATITLGDGTVIKLNSGSSLKYPKVFSSDKREVFLEGEAFFEVAPNPDKPFIVVSGDLQTKVLGTAFNVKAYSNDNKVQVAVLHGKVGVKVPAKEDLILLPNESAIYSKSDSDVKKAKFDMEKEFAWKDDVIYFKNSDFDEIKNVLERWYGVKFKFNKIVKIDKDFTGKFENRSLESVLEGISFSLNFQFDIDNDTVLIF